MNTVAFVLSHMTTNMLSELLFSIRFFLISLVNASLFHKTMCSSKIILLIYVDDTIVTVNALKYVEAFIATLCNTLADLCQLKFFLGIECVYQNSSMILSQSRYIEILLQKYGFNGKIVLLHL